LELPHELPPALAGGETNKYFFSALAKSTRKFFEFIFPDKLIHITVKVRVQNVPGYIICSNFEEASLLKSLYIYSLNPATYAMQPF
jgi:hypothetical protein